jgi:transcriptional regulator with XRE-family HTH domain
MPAQRRPPSARDRALGAQLRLIRREQTDLSMEAAAKLLQWSLTSMSRTENGKRRITPEDVATVLATYRVPLAQRNALVAKAKANDEQAWWHRHMTGLPRIVDSLAGFETEAHTVTEWSITLIPGLLQTYEYAKAVLTMSGATPDEIEVLWKIRVRRQQRRPKFDYSAYLYEGAVRTPFGGRAFFNQIRHLLDVSEKGVGIRIVPEHRPHPVLLHSWLMMEFPDSPRIVHVELAKSAVLLYDAETDLYTGQRAALNEIALSSSESRDMLRSLLRHAEQRSSPPTGSR